jgi:TrmH family RNA methyltransferase
MPALLVTSRANPRVKQLRAAFTGNARLSGGLVAIEGEHLLSEAIRAGLVLKTIFVCESRTPPPGLPRGVELIELSAELFASVADTQSPQGIAALLVPPTWTLEDALPAKPRTAPLLLIAAALQDPGNLGTLIRSAEAFGVTGVLTTAGTVSPWNQKALRASAGSVFRVPVVAVTPAEILMLKSRGMSLLAAVAPGSGPTDTRSPIPATDANLVTPCAVMIGNEGAGLSADLIALADSFIAIPMPGPVESLNAAIAGSLLLYEAARQRTSNLVPRT